MFSQCEGDDVKTIRSKSQVNKVAMEAIPQTRDTLKQNANTLLVDYLFTFLTIFYIITAAHQTIKELDKYCHFLCVRKNTFRLRLGLIPILSVFVATFFIV